MPAGNRDPKRLGLAWERVKPMLLKLACGYLIWLGIALGLQRKVVFPRGAAQALQHAGSDIANLEKSWLATDDGRVGVWFAPVPDAEGPRPAVVFAHGNAELIDDQAASIALYHELGLHILLVEYRGYGRSDGSPTQTNITADHVGAYYALAKDPRVDKTKIFFHGHSVGTGIVCSLAATRPPAGLILRAPFRSIASMLLSYGIPWFLVLDPLDNEAVIRKLDVPVLVLHGDQDTVIPVGHGEAVARAAKRGTFKVYPGAGHNDFPEDGAVYRADITALLRDAGWTPPIPQRF